MTQEQQIAVARNARVGYAVDSGYERLEKLAPDTWKFTNEGGGASIHDDRTAAEILESTFPGSPA